MTVKERKEIGDQVFVIKKLKDKSWLINGKKLQSKASLVKTGIRYNRGYENSQLVGK